ncbi:hypothetical protein MMF96_01285 [Arthrobacter sp. STN4]|nr:hypothetical protein [Arthrobacter sp. SDTb3-6]MCQ9162696.1 hypothetical protein [Arthrobacter sp. STN4]NVM97321.1 hypothetical protein [Arthrobacter sp. SDTb3-6]
MARDEKFVIKFMHATEKFQKVFGPADQGDSDAPVVHRHDAFEEASEQQLAHFEQRTGSDGQHYAVEKDEETA